MITFAPSPSWNVLSKLILAKIPEDSKLSKPWCKSGDQVIWFSRTAWALHTMVRWWEVNIGSAPVVWVPGYFCNQSLWPLRQTSAKIVFYPIQEQMQPNWEGCEKLETQAKPDIFIVTHFYGFIIPTKEIEIFCKKHNALLVEDAAHVLIPTGDVGEHGHLILYSPYKLFPIPHGAACVVRPKMREYLEKNNRKQVASIQEISHKVGMESPPVFIWFIKKIIQKLIGDKLDFLRKRKPFEEDGTSSPMPYTPQMHPMTKKMLYLMQNQISKQIDYRKKCADLWENIFAENNISAKRLKFNSEEIPYVGVFKSTDNEASKIYDKYSSWPLSSWPDLPPEVRANPEIHKTTIEFRENMLIVPVHQTLKFSELKRRFGKFRKSFLNLNHKNV